MGNIRTSAPRPNRNSPGAGKTPKPLHTIVAAEDILVWPQRDQDSVEYNGDFVMKDGCKMEQIYGTPSKFDGGYSSDGEEDAQSVAQKTVIEHPGDALASENFAQSWFGVPCIIITDYCDGSPKKVYGTECAPLQMKLEFVHNADKTGYIFTFEAFGKTNWLAGRYTGNLVFAAPFTVADNEQLALEPANGYQYKLATGAGNTITVTSNTMEHGDVITLIGSGGGTADTLTTSATMLLVSTWTALEGAVLTLQVFESNSTKFLIEKNRA